MVLSFSFKNYKSYKEEANLLFTTNAKIRTHKDHAVKVGKYNVLEYLAIIGSNAGGKSNLIKAVEFFKMFVLAPSLTNDFISFKGMEKENSAFKIILSLEDKLYEYSYSISRTNNILGVFEVRNEDLFEITNNKRINIYSLGLNKQNNKLEISINKKYKLNADLGIYLKNYNSDQNKYSLFLSYINNVERKSHLPVSLSILNRIYSYIESKIIVIKTNPNNYSFVSSDTLDDVSCVLKNFDIGINDVKLVKIEGEELRRNIPSELLPNILYDFNKFGKKRAIITNMRNLFCVEKIDNDFVFKKLVFSHRSIKDSFDLVEESDGTIRLLCLASLLFSKIKDVTFFVDEIDRSLHPLATIDFIKEVINHNNKENNHNQVVFTTHLIELLDKKFDVLRFDEFYFVDKDNSGSSTLYSLSEYKSRSDANVKLLYYEGRYSALPNINIKG